MDAATVPIEYVEELTGFTKRQIQRMAARKMIPGAFQVRPGCKGSRWRFHRGKLHGWFSELTGNSFLF